MSEFTVDMQRDKDKFAIFLLKKSDPTKLYSLIAARFTPRIHVRRIVGRLNKTGKTKYAAKRKDL